MTFFWEAGWIGYFQILNRFHEEKTIQFSMNLNGEYSIIRGLWVDASEWFVAEVTRLPRTGERWFTRKRHNLRVTEKILAPGEQVQRRARGVALERFPRPWGQVVVFLKRYITCEGIFRVVSICYFVLLSHLHHGRLINMPFYLSNILQNMAHYVRSLDTHSLLSQIMGWSNCWCKDAWHIII